MSCGASLTCPDATSVAWSAPSGVADVATGVPEGAWLASDAGGVAVGVALAVLVFVAVAVAEADAVLVFVAVAVGLLVVFVAVGVGVGVLVSATGGSTLGATFPSDSFW